MTKVKKNGTMISVIRRQHAAVDALVAGSRRSNPASTRGEVRGELAGALMRDELVQAIVRSKQTERPDNKGLADFRQQTQLNLRIKRSVATWAGERPGPVKLRRKRETTSRPKTQHRRGPFQCSAGNSVGGLLVGGERRGFCPPARGARWL